jgi:hypothetical protein
MAANSAGLSFETRTLDDLTIEDEPSFRHVGLYADLKQVLRRADFRFRVLPANGKATWDRALFLNLTYWRPEAGGDVLLDATIPADVVAHVAWHHLAGVALAATPGAPPSVPDLFMGEAIASAFDLYLVGRLLGHAPESSFLETQVLAMKDVAGAAGLDDPDFAALLTQVADSPERAFADLRALLFDACTALYASADTEAALRAFGKLDAHRFAPLLHHYELSNWILYARAQDRTDGSDRGSEDEPADSKTRVLDFGLRERPDALDWLSREWVAPALR